MKRDIVGAAMFLALGLVSGTLSPTLAETNRGATLAAGYFHTCAVLADGRVQCWGANELGQLGDGSTKSGSAVPVTVSGITGAVAVSGGYFHTCAVLADGRVQCWGSNHSGELGKRTANRSTVPVTVSDITHAVAVTSGYKYSCALLADGRVQCWGNNDLGQLGNGSIKAGSAVPVTVSGLTNAVAIIGGGEHACAVLADGRVRCWGSNQYGQLGNGTTSKSSFVPVTVRGLTNVVAVAGGGGHTCALLTDGRVECWGSNGEGRLGDGTTVQYSAVPVTVSGLTNAVAITGGGGHACAVLADGRVQCWGSNHSGELGNESRISSPIPVTVSGLTNAVAEASGLGHSCAVLADGRIQCWGSNGGGQLGNGTTTSSWVPVTVNGITNSVRVVGGTVR